MTSGSSTHSMNIEDSIQVLLRSNFDSVSKAAVILIMKYLSNIIANPSEAKFRVINTANKAFVDKIGSSKGGIDIFFSIGFEGRWKEDLRPVSVFDTTPRETPSFESIQLPSTSNDNERLLQAFSTLSQAASTLGVALEDIPILKIKEATPQPPIPADFDPFRSQVHRTAPQPTRVASITEQKLEVLRQRRKELEG